MADFGSPVASPNPVGSGLSMLSDLMNLKRSQQALQTGVYQQQTAQAGAQQAQQQNQELQALAQFTRSAAQDPAYHNPDGSLNVQKYQTDAMKSAPTYGQAYIGQMTSNANAMVDNRKALLGLANEQRQTIGGYFGAVAAKPNATVEDFANAAEQARGVSDDPGYQKAVDRMLMSMPQVATLPTAQASAAIQQHARGIALQTNAPNAAVSQPSQSTMQAPGGLQGVNLNPNAPGGVGPQGAPMAQGISPQIVTSPITGGQGVVGGSQGLMPRPIGGGGNAWQPYPGQQGDIQNFRQEVQNTRQAGDQAPLARNINQQILRLADNAKTGPGTEIWQHAVGALGAPFGLSPSASYQEIGKFLEKNAIANMQSMGGPPSDARLSAAAAANGSTTFSPEALKAVTKFNNATNTALMQYRQGMDNAVGMGQNVDYSKLPAFKAAWAKNFDVDIYRLDDAVRDKDVAEQKQIVNSLSPEQRDALRVKRRNLNLLAQGQIPP